MRNEQPTKDTTRELRFIVSAIRTAYKQSNIKTLSIYDDLDQVDKNRLEAALAKQQRNAPKRKAVVEGLREVVECLRNEGVSWAKVSDYIAKHHKKRISRGYLHKIFAGEL